MKYQLHIEKGPNVSFYCEGWAEGEEGRTPLKIKVLNRTIAELITGPMKCEILSPDEVAAQGNIQKAGKENDFVFIKNNPS